MGFQKWETPPELFDKLAAAFAFTIDAAAEPHNAKCERYIDEATDALTVTLAADEVAFVNPPYAVMEPWAAQFIAWALAGATVVVLAQDKTDTGWYRRLAYHAFMVVTVSERISFRVPEGSNVRSSDNFHGATIFVLDKPSASRPRKSGDRLPYMVWEWKREPFPSVF